MSTVHEKTDMFINRHGENTNVVKLKVEGKGDMIGKTYLIRVGSPIYGIQGNNMTEREVGRAGSDDTIKVEKVLAVENEWLHPSTWSQNGNVFLVSGDKYIHFGAASNILNIVPIVTHNVKKSIEDTVDELGNKTTKLSQWIVGILLVAFIVFMFEEHFLKKHFTAA